MSDDLQRRFLTGCPIRDINPTLRDLACNDTDEPFKPRTEVEDAVFAALPGDDLSEHPLGPHTNNPYLGKPVAELKALLNSEDLVRAERMRIKETLKQYHNY